MNYTRNKLRITTNNNSLILYIFISILLTIVLSPSIMPTHCRLNIFLSNRGIAQSGSAPALGAGCREFESLYPDHFHFHKLVATKDCALGKNMRL